MIDRILNYKEPNISGDYVEINGVKWAKLYIESPGKFDENTWRGNIFYLNDNGTIDWYKYHPNGTIDRSKRYVVELQDICPKGWRLPTPGELIKLSQANYKGYSGNTIIVGDNALLWDKKNGNDIPEGTIKTMTHDTYLWANDGYPYRLSFVGKSIRKISPEHTIDKGTCRCVKE